MVRRIVFHPHIDEGGRLHEASAVRAVVANGEWQQALGQAVVPSARLSYGSGSPETHADAVDRVDPPGGTLAAVDPDMPERAVVATPRPRNTDSAVAIQAGLPSRLTPPPQRPRGPPAGRGGVPHPPAAGAPSPQTTAKPQPEAH